MFVTPDDPVIAICWMIFVAVWAVSAFFVKRTAERSLSWLWLLAVAAFGFGLIGVIPGVRRPLWPQTAAIWAMANILTVTGLAVTLWARAVLGQNWSGAIVLKESHELIRRGPYAFVRHPIYSGLLLMLLGTALASARLSSFLVLAMTFVLVAIKARFEEQFMTRHFPDAYPEYRRQVKALIPGIW